MGNHRSTDISWEVISGVIRAIYIGALVVLLTYFILCTLNYIDINLIDLSPWTHIIIWTFFSVFSVILTIVHFVLTSATSEKTPALTGSVIRNVALTLLITLALFIVYITAENNIDSSVQTAGMRQFYEQRKHFFLVLLMIGSAILFGESLTLAVLYRK